MRIKYLKNHILIVGADLVSARASDFVSARANYLVSTQGNGSRQARPLRGTIQTAILKNKAFTLLEVLLASIIFVISVAGLFATLNAVRTPVAAQQGALSATVFGNQVLEALRDQVTPQTYYNACSLPLVAGVTVNGNVCPAMDLSLGTHEVPQANFINNLTWPSNLSALNPDAKGGLVYTVSCADGIAAAGNPPACSSSDIARQTTLNITTS